MRVSSLPLTVVLSLAAFAASHAVACHDDEDDPPPAELADVVYVGGTTDEALEAMLKWKIEPGSKRAAITAPSQASKLSEPPMFEWTLENRTGGVGPLERAPRHAPAAPARPALHFGMKAAHAHGDPFNGTGYLLVLSTESYPKLLRVFTNAPSYKLDAATWDRVKKAAGGFVTASVTTAFFENDRLAPNGGPFEGEAKKFEIAQ